MAYTCLSFGLDLWTIAMNRQQSRGSGGDCLQPNVADHALCSRARFGGPAALRVRRLGVEPCARVKFNQIFAKSAESVRRPLGLRTRDERAALQRRQFRSSGAVRTCDGDRASRSKRREQRMAYTSTP